MRSKPPHPIKHCPVCGVAMVARKSSESAPRVDTFECLSCNATIVERPGGGAPDNNQK